MNKWVRVAVIAAIVIVALRYRNQIAGVVGRVPFVGSWVG